VTEKLEKAFDVLAIGVFYLCSAVAAVVIFGLPLYPYYFPKDEWVLQQARTANCNKLVILDRFVLTSMKKGCHAEENVAFALEDKCHSKIVIVCVQISPIVAKFRLLP
jgi:hypothetical protein